MQYPDIAPNMWKMCHWDGQNNRGFCILYQYISMLAWWWDFIRSTSYKLQLLIQYFWRFYLLYRAYYGAFFYMKSIKHFKYYYLWLLYFATFYRQGIWCLALCFLVIRIHSSNSHYVIVPTTKPTKCGFRSMINVLLSALPIHENQTFCPSVHSSCNRVSSVDLRWQKTTCSDGCISLPAWLLQPVLGSPSQRDISTFALLTLLYYNTVYRLLHSFLITEQTCESAETLGECKSVERLDSVLGKIKSSFIVL